MAEEVLFGDLVLRYVIKHLEGNPSEIVCCVMFPCKL